MSASSHRVSEDEEGQRIDRWFRKSFPGLSQGAVEKLLRTGQIRLDGARIKASARIKAGQEIRVPPVTQSVEALTRPKTAASEAKEEDKAFIESLVIYKDKDVLALNKPAGLAVQGGTGTKRHIDGMLNAFNSNTQERPRLVHRLDRDTSGVLLLARTGQAATRLTAAFRERDTQKIYWAICVGVPKIAKGTIDLALSKGVGKFGREKMLPDDFDDDDERPERGEAAKKAVTHYAVVARAGKRLSFVALMPVTGRTHQLRAHMAAIGTPVLGDGKYGGAEAYIEGDFARQLHLHAFSINIRHPNGTRLKVEAPLSKHMQAAFELCGFEAREAKNIFAGLDK